MYPPGQPAIIIQYCRNYLVEGEDATRFYKRV
jgi:hypothetical protein